ncbi:MAG TPA: hypothetical protein VN031_00540 [Candidatus Microsaccharimonas sp.]|nr:hypothetical protein [Candidatus Microsaccharimonas sp.]
MMGLLTNSAVFELARVGLLLVLLALLFTTPPRHNTLRFFTGSLAFGIMLAVAYLTYNNLMNILDTLAFSGAGVVLGLTALEAGNDVEEVDIEALRRAKMSGPLIPKH